jgi:hypothetical protein
MLRFGAFPEGTVKKERFRSKVLSHLCVSEATLSCVHLLVLAARGDTIGDRTGYGTEAFVRNRSGLVWSVGRYIKYNLVRTH